MTVSRIDEARLSVLLDVRHPLAYLALQPAADLGAELAIDVNWLPLVSPPLNPPSQPGPDDDRGARHRRHRALAIAQEIETYAEVQGLVLRDYYRDGDPSAVNLGWLWLRERHPERLLAYLTQVFRAYWALELDAGSEKAVAEAVDAVGGDAAGFQAWAGDGGPVTTAALAEELRGRGLFGVPGYLVEDEFFLGRQHLPMIRWILEGRQGRGPI